MSGLGCDVRSLGYPNLLKTAVEHEIMGLIGAQLACKQACRAFGATDIYTEFNFSPDTCHVM
jgi:hypothetical protein